MVLMLKAFAPCVLLGTLFSAQPVLAKDIIVQMKNRAAAGMMVFEPAFVRAK